MRHNKYSLNENVEQAKSLLKKLNIPADNEDYQIIRGMLERKMGWVGLFCTYRFVQKIGIDSLAQTFDQLTELDAFLNRLPQLVTQYAKYEDLVDALNRLAVTRLSSKLYQQLTSKFKAVVKAMDEEEKAAFDRIAFDFYQLTEPQQTKLLEKLRGFEPSKFMEGFANYLDAINSAFDYEMVKEQVEETDGGAVVVHDKPEDNILVVRIKTFTASMMLSSRTLWCIRNNVENWDDYVDGDDRANTQYTIYNFNLPSRDKMSMVGVTVQPGSTLRAAHARFDEKISTPVLKKYLAKLNIDFAVLAPLSAEEVAEKRKESRRRTKIANAIKNYDSNKVLALLLQEDVWRYGLRYALFAARCNRLDLLQRVESLGFKATPDTDLFRSACIAKATSIIDYLREKGFVATDDDQIHYIKYLMETDKDGSTAQAYLEENQLNDVVLAKVYAMFLERNLRDKLVWMHEQHPLPDNKRTRILANALQTFVMHPATVKAELERGATLSSDALKGMSIQYAGFDERQQEAADFYLDLLVKQKDEIDKRNSPVRAAADKQNWWAVRNLIKAGIPDDTRGAGVVAYLRVPDFNMVDTILKRAENSRLDTSEFIQLYMASKPTLAGLKFIHERGIKSGGTVYKYFQGIDMLALAIRHSLGYDIIKYLMSLEYYSVQSDIIDKIVAVAKLNDDPAMVRKLSHHENVTDSVAEATVALMVKNKQIDELIEYVSDISEEFQYAISADAMVELLSIHDRTIFEQLFKNPIKSLPINKMELDAIFPSDYHFKMDVVARLSFDARDLVALFIKHSYSACATRLFAITEPKVVAKIQKRKDEILAALANDESTVAGYVKEQLNGVHENWNHAYVRGLRLRM